jgi:hypothetical protein
MNQREIRVLYYGSCWPTNIGNAFVNLGAINSIKQALGDAGTVDHFGGLSSYLFTLHHQPENSLLLGALTRYDYVVIGGMTQCAANFEAAQTNLRQFMERGAKVVIAGGGAERYNDEEVRLVREWMQRLPIYGFISRDEYSYENYRDLAEHSYNGVDSAFYIADGFHPIPLDDCEFVVLNFDKFPEPILRNPADPFPTASTVAPAKGWSLRALAKGILRRGERDEDSRPVLDLQGARVIRTHHSTWPTSLQDRMFSQKQTLISDLPSDYLTLYATAKAVYSDRVHACVATLSFGNRAMLFGKSNPRIRMFQRVRTPRIFDEPVSVDMDFLNTQKAEQVSFLRRILTG